nr:class I SAM-dependent methyltransferase [Rhizobium sp. RHZ01]
MDPQDISIYSAIRSSTTDNDRASLLRLLALISSTVRHFNYLEIGSDRGGSLVPLLADPNCAAVISVDLRPAMQPDERGVDFPYPIDGEEQMMKNLRAHFDENKLKRLKTFKLDIRDVSPDLVPKIDWAFIDGEHTNTACFSDADRVLDFVKDDAVVAFHDSTLISDAIQNFERLLTRLNIEHSTVFLPDTVAAIGIGKFSQTLARELGSISAERSSFFAGAQLHRWLAVANSMKDQGLVQFDDTDKEREQHQLREEVAVLTAQRDEALQIAKELRQSTSWRATAPLRSAMNFIRRR